MLKKTVVTFISIFVSVSLTAFAASPQQNTEAVQKAFIKMQQALQHKTLEYDTHNSIKDNVSAKVRKIADNKTNSTKNLSLSKKVKILANTTKKDNSIVIKTSINSCDNKTKKRIEAIQKRLSTSTKSTKRLKTETPSLIQGTIVKNIKAMPVSVVINYNGNIKYHIFTILNYKITAIDIIAPKKVYSYLKNTIIPQNSDMIKKVVTVYHNNKNIYGRPFFRVAINLYKNLSHKIIEKPDKLIIKFIEIKKGILKTNNTHAHILKASKNHKKLQIKKPKAQLAKTYNISLKSISRIISPYPIEKVIYSREKYVQLQVINNSIYIKPLPMKILLPDGSFAYNYSKQSRDIYIITDAKVYSLHLVPLDIPSVTYNLEPIYDKSLTELQQAKIKFLQDSSVEPYAVNFPTNTYTASILSLIKSAYHGSIPTGYNILPFVKEKDNPQYSLIGQYILKGQYILCAYKITALERVNLTEKTFANFVNDPLAVTIIKPNLLAGDSTMLFIVGGNDVN